MKKYLPLVLVIAAIYAVQFTGESSVSSDLFGQSAPSQADSAWQAGQQVSGSGVVVRVLPDDNDGSRHQRFILRLGSGRTLLIAHNIDLASRIYGLSAGDTVSFFGEFEPNPEGGVIHWTHHDPQGRHVDGWLEHRGRRYQ